LAVPLQYQTPTSARCCSTGPGPGDRTRRRDRRHDRVREVDGSRARGRPGAVHPRGPRTAQGSDGRVL